MITLCALLLGPTAAVGAIQQQNDASTAQIIADLTSENRDRRITGHIQYIRIPPDPCSPKTNFITRSDARLHISFRVIRAGRFRPGLARVWTW